MIETIKDVNGTVYITCSACMSVYADAISWADQHRERVSDCPEKSDNIIILGCQVTDLAVYSVFELAKKYKPRKVYISGCLAEREDIEFPEGLGRLRQFRGRNEFIQKHLVNFENPFWVQDYKQRRFSLTAGNLFRSHYPLRIGRGCENSCTYCKINKTRCGYEVYDREKVLDEFKSVIECPILLVSDNPSGNDIRYWISQAVRLGKKIAIRNLEPKEFNQCWDSIEYGALSGRLEIVHCPIQSMNKSVLSDMGRSHDNTMVCFEEMKRLKKKYPHLIIATNIITHYKDFMQSFDAIYDVFDYVSTNPLWDGVWEPEKAKSRFNSYILGL